jgi:hypothetical protein
MIKNDQHSTLKKETFATMPLAVAGSVECFVSVLMRILNFRRSVLAHLEDVDDLLLFGLLTAAYFT